MKWKKWKVDLGINCFVSQHQFFFLLSPEKKVILKRCKSSPMGTFFLSFLKWTTSNTPVHVKSWIPHPFCSIRWFYCRLLEAEVEGPPYICENWRIQTVWKATTNDHKRFSQGKKPKMFWTSWYRWANSRRSVYFNSSNCRCFLSFSRVLQLIFFPLVRRSDGASEWCLSLQSNDASWAALAFWFGAPEMSNVWHFHNIEKKEYFSDKMERRTCFAYWWGVALQSDTVAESTKQLRIYMWSCISIHADR